MYRKIIKIFSETVYTGENLKRNANMYTFTYVIDDMSEQNVSEVIFALNKLIIFLKNYIIFCKSWYSYMFTRTITESKIYCYNLLYHISYVLENFFQKQIMKVISRKTIFLVLFNNEWDTKIFNFLIDFYFSLIITVYTSRLLNRGSLIN